ncbi:ankyrin repeat domain-containing protein [Luteithermobacter gelatinilyticus]|uniref:ankyrin repeat domain-containing protein n=1 Tax=Luteithermobacter gelatinilyticus TaxID=2582913 RepID=UPI0011057BCA|nr:ankyrin repeat domain-containing protein [Luteithermobacter gelatinilyticus]
MANRDDVFKAIDVADGGKLKEILDQDPGLASARSADGLSAVLFTLYLQKQELTDILMSYEPKLDLFDLAALGMNDLLDVLLKDQRVDVNMFAGDGFTALHLAAFFGQAETVDLLLARGADPNAMAPNGSALCPLHSAVASGQTDIVKALLVAGADPDAQQDGGYTALMSSAHQGHEDIVRVLLDHGANKEIIAADGRKASDFARAAGQTALRELLE